MSPKKFFMMPAKRFHDRRWSGSMSNAHHPVWGLARVAMVCATLLGLQLITATQYDVALDGEAGTLGGVALATALLEYLRKD